MTSLPQQGVWGVFSSWTGRATETVKPQSTWDPNRTEVPPPTPFLHILVSQHTHLCPPWASWFSGPCAVALVPFAMNSSWAVWGWGRPRTQTHTNRQTHMHTHSTHNAQMHTCTHLCKHICTNTHVQTSMHTPAYLHMHACTHMYTCTLTYTCTCSRTHKHLESFPVFPESDSSRG